MHGKNVSRALASIRPTNGIIDAVETLFNGGIKWVFLIDGGQGHQALVRGDALSFFQVTLRCEPGRTFVPGTCPLRFAAALIAPRWVAFLEQKTPNTREFARKK